MGDQWELGTGGGTEIHNTVETGREVGDYNKSV